QGWGAISKVIMAAEEAQIWCMSNAGDAQSVLLNHLRGIAMAGTDPTMFHAEWSAEPGEGYELDSPHWAVANPSLGHPNGITMDAIRSAFQTDPPNVFRTEVLCQFVDVMNHAVDSSAWMACADPTGAMPAAGRPALAVERSVNGDQVVAVSAVVMTDGRVRVEVVGVWESTTEARYGLDDLRTVLRPAAMGWFPKGPGAPLGSTMRRHEAFELKGLTVPEVCMTFASLVDDRRI